MQLKALVCSSLVKWGFFFGLVLFVYLYQASPSSSYNQYVLLFLSLPSWGTFKLVSSFQSLRYEAFRSEGMSEPFAVCMLIRVGFLIFAVSFLCSTIWETVMLNQSSKISGDHFQLHCWFISVLTRWLQVPVTVRESFWLPYLSLPVLNLRVKSHVTHLPER